MSKRIFRRALATFLTGALLVSTIGLTGCSGKKEIVLWNQFTGSDGAYFQQMVDAYNKTGPDYKIKNVVVPDMYTKIYTLMNSKKEKDIPDLVMYHAEKVNLFAQQGLIEPMDDMIAKQPNIKAENYLEESWDVGEVDGIRYAVPLDVHSSLLLYNKDLLDKYGPGVLDDETVTVDEVKAIAEKAKKDNICTYPINLESWTLMSLVTELGGEIHDNGVPTINTPQMKQAFETLKELVEIGATQEDGDDGIQLFQSGNSVFFQGATWDGGPMSEIEGLNWGFTNTLAFKSGEFSNWTSSHQFGLLTKTRTDEVKDGIGNFMEYVRMNSTVWAESGQNPASNEVIAKEEYSKYPQSFLMKNDKEKASLKIYNFANNGNTLDALGSIARDVIFGKLDVVAGLEKAQKTVDDKLKAGE